MNEPQVLTAPINDLRVCNAVPREKALRAQVDADLHGPAREAFWPSALAYVACFCFMTWPWLSGRVTIPWDAKAHFQPQIQFLADSLARGESPFWNPYVFSGHPQIADPQSMIFSPPFLLLALLNGSPSLWAVDLTLLVAMCAGGLALLAWFRDRDWHWCGGLIAAIAFSFGAAMAWRIQHIGQVLSLAYLPIALLCLDRAIARGSLLYGAVGGLVGAFIVLGRDQIALLCVYLLAAYVLWRLIGERTHPVPLLRRLLPLAVGGLVAVAVAFVPVVLTALLAGESNRPEIDYIGAGRGSLHPALLLTLVTPNLFGAAGDMADYWGPPSYAWQGTDLFIAQNVGELYVGAIPLLLVLGALAAGWLWAREIRFFTCALAVMLLYALGWYTPAFRVMHELLPGVSLYRRPADAVFLVGGMAAIVAGYAAHSLATRPWLELTRQQYLAVAGTFLLALLAAVVLGVQLDRIGRVPVPLGLAAATFAAAVVVLAWARNRMVLTPRAAVLALAAFTAADLAWNNGPNTSSAMPPAHYDVLEPATRNETIALLKAKVAADASATRRDRVELAGLGFHWPNASMTHRLENTLGYNPLRLRLYSNATGAEDHVGLPDQRKFSALMPSYRSRLSNLLGLRYIATGVPIEQIDKRLRAGDLSLVARTTDGFIYENPDTLPRVLFAHEARPEDFDSLLAAGNWPDFNPAQTVLLGTPAVSVQVRRPGTAEIRTYRNTEIVVDADSRDGGWVVLNDVWQPWWFAEVDGKEARLLRANVLFRAVEVPPGRHTVRFEFRPLRGAWIELRRRMRGK